MRLEGYRAMVTGAGSGIGRATAQALAAEGALVGVLDVDGDGADQTVATVEQDGGTAVAIACDVSSEPAVQEAVDGLVEGWGGLDVVVANAAVQLFGQDDRVDRLERDVWEKVLAVNLTGAYLTCKHGIRALVASGGGSVVCTVSRTAVSGIGREFAAYTASKAGLLGLMRVMATDYAAEGVRVNAVMPGHTRTPLVAEVQGDKLERRVQRTPLGRPGQPEDIAPAMVFLASEDARYMTGSVVTVDGGDGVA